MIAPTTCAMWDDVCARAQLLSEIDAILGSGGEAVLGESTADSPLVQQTRARSELLRELDHVLVVADEEVLGEQATPDGQGSDALDEAVRGRVQILEELHRTAE